MIQDPKNVLQMLNLLQTCPETLQVSLSLPGCVCRFGVGIGGFVIQNPKNVLQMLNLLQTCPETLQVC